VARLMIDQILFSQMQRANTLKVPGKVIFGEGAARSVVDEAKTMGCKRLLLVTDAQVLKSGVLYDVVKSLSANMQVKIFSEVEPEPDIMTADLVTRTVREGEFDLVCGMGGGSVMDIAKIASVMATNSGDTEQYVGVDLLKEPGLAKILLPTTAGTGSEMTPNAIVGLHEKGAKVGVISPYIMADAAVVDPLLTVTLPAKPTASSGLDALAHAIESYISLDSNPITDLLSLRAIELIMRNLPMVFSEGDNVRARSAMSLCAMMAGISIANAGTCSGHAAAYGYAGKYNIPHGFSVAVALPHVLEFSLRSCPQKAKAIAETMGVATSGVSSADAGTQVIKAIVSLMREVECPTSLSQLGVPRAEIPTLARNMLKTARLLVHNPRSVNEVEAVEIITRMWEGKLGPS